MANQEGEKKKFQFANKEDLVIQIKGLGEEIQHISLNLVKCHFEATQSDVIKAFPQFTFIKVKNYKPGSFELVFQLRIDAINFIRTCYDKKILNRRFYIKLGRQSTQTIEDWAFVGYVPRNFQHNKRQNIKKDTKSKYQQKNNDKSKQEIEKKQIVEHEEKKQQNKDQKRETLNKSNQEIEKLQKQESTIVQVQKNINQKKQTTKKQQQNIKDKNVVQKKLQSAQKKQQKNQVQKSSEVEQKVKKVMIVEQKKQTITIQGNNQKNKKNKKGQQKASQGKQEEHKQETQKLDDDGWIVVKAKNKRK